MLDDWHPADIKAAVYKRSSTLAELARKAGLSRAAMAAALHTRSSERADNIIADFLGVPPQKIWPSRYRADGTRIRFKALSARSGI